jgi:chitinase
MPAICRNIQNWRSDPQLSGWHVNSLWDHWFTFDLGASRNSRDRGNARRQRQCPSSWKKRSDGSPRCPEVGQPPVVPPLWDSNGFPVTQIVPQQSGAPVNLKIADGRDQQYVGQVQDSGRVYSCDEFPPASWIEGGHGISGDPTATEGTTYCAPKSIRCSGDNDPRGSEQDWQGRIHGVLGTKLETDLSDARKDYDEETPVAFKFTASTQASNVVWAARVLYEEGSNLLDEPANPGTHWQRRGGDSQLREILLIPMENGNGSAAIHLPNGEVFRSHEHKSLEPLLHRIRQLGRREAKEPTTTGMGNQTQTPDWYVFFYPLSKSYLAHSVHYGLRT